MQIRKTYKEALSKLKGKTKTTATGLTKFMYWMGGETVGGGTAMIKMGGKGALGIGARDGNIFSSGTGITLVSIISPIFSSSFLCSLYSNTNRLDLEGKV